MTDLCDAGYYCLNSSVSKQPSDPLQGGVCPSGRYCPKGSSTPKLCDPGKYCPSQGLYEPFANCSAGFYCWLGAQSSRPNDNVTGNACPQGGFCPEGQQNFTLCPPGTFSNSTNNTMLKDCLECTSGSYCLGYGNADPTGPCKAGYYCPKGQNREDPSGYRCPQGHYCPAGSSEGIPCMSGNYQDEMQQENCKVR